MSDKTFYPSVRQPILAKNIVSTSQPLASQAGIRALLNGGNAVDAAIAAAITLTVVEPTSNGIGSDAFAIIWDGGSLHGLNASGRSPAGWMPEHFSRYSKMPERGWDTVTVPGAVSAWRALSERFGRLDFEDLFLPAIQYARDGYPVSPIIANSWARAAQVLKDQPGFAQAFMPNGATPKAGETFRLPDMAVTLERIAASGGESFYEGELGREIVRFSQSGGGRLTMEDLESHAVTWCGVLSLDFFGFQIHEIPPNGQGIAALIALGILREHGGIDVLDPDRIESIHLQIEAMKLAFADLHQYVSDPAWMETSPASLIDDQYLSDRAQTIDPNRAQLPDYGVPAKSGTVYLSAADSHGMMVSFIQSNYMGFGSGIVVPGTGISLQNRGNCFRLEQGHANSVGPSKRPFHTIIPGFVTKDGAAVMSFGVMGGAMQAQGHVQMAIRVLLHGQNPQAASDSPRWQLLDGGVVAVEEAMNERVIEGLRALGHTVQVEAGWANQSFGGAQLILKTASGYIAGSDQRKDGQATGF